MLVNLSTIKKHFIKHVKQIKKQINLLQKNTKPHLTHFPLTRLSLPFNVNDYISNNRSLPSFIINKCSAQPSPYSTVYSTPLQSISSSASEPIQTPLHIQKKQIAGEKKEFNCLKLRFLLRFRFFECVCVWLSYLSIQYVNLR